jgi:hypothetical protein
MPKLKTSTHEYKGLLSITMELEIRIFSFTGYWFISVQHLKKRFNLHFHTYNFGTSIEVYIPKSFGSKMVKWLFTENNIFLVLFIVLGLISLYGIVWFVANKLRIIHFRLVVKYLKKSHKKTLRKHFPFYKKLSLELREIFEERVIHFLYQKKYKTNTGDHVTTKKKLLIAAYAAQMTMGIENFYFNKIKLITVFPFRFTDSTGKLSSWEVLSNGEIKLSWKDFFKELHHDKKIIPVGIKIMAHAMKLEDLTPIKEQLSIYNTPEIYKHVVPSVYTRDDLFTNYTINTRDEFIVACLVNYFGNPVALKNAYPEIFRRLEKSLYSGI